MELDAFQHEVLAFFDTANGRAIYADDMGGRKTATTLTWISEVEDISTTLIVVPKSVHVDHWLQQAEEWAPRFTRYNGTGPKRDAALDQCAATGGIYATTYASARLDRKKLAHKKFKCVVFDEGHALKGRRTQVALMANELAKAENCLIVTGTPVMGKPEEMWQYLHMLYPKSFTSYWRWVREHFFTEFLQFAGQREPVEVVGDYREGHEDIVRAQLSGVIIQREIGELFPGAAFTQEPVFLTFPVKLSTAESDLYDSLVVKGWGRTPSGVVTTKNKISVQTRLRQITSDWGNLDDDHAHGTKLTYAADDIALWSKHGGPVIAFTAYVPSAHRLVDALVERGVRAFPYTGQQNAALRAVTLARWHAGEVDVLVGTIAAMGEGVDGLQFKSHKVALFDLDWTPAINDQCIGRAKRSGQEKRVEVRHYYYEDTIEASVVDTNRRKINMVQSLRGRPIRDIIYGHTAELVIL